jgi:uncharacterized alpha-E superfamily protein
MLSRVAESLFWMARYIERAEDLTRLLAVNFNALLDTQPEFALQGWQPLVTMTGDEDVFTTAFGTANAQSVMEFMLWNPLNPNAVTACINRARENARGVREQISSEMWEHINRLYFITRDANRVAVLANPLEFFAQVRDGSQAFQGITSATLTHGEPYHFIQLGALLERADKTARILNAKYMYIERLPRDSAETSLQLIALLRSCSAFEPFRRAAKGEMSIELVVDYLLLDRAFPRAVLFCLNQSLNALDILGDTGNAHLKSANPRRTLGRVSADLEYLDIHEVLGEGMDPYLEQLLVRLNTVGDDIARAFFNTRVILPDSRPQQQQQQQ